MSSFGTATNIFGPIIIDNSFNNFPDLILHNPKNLKNDTVMEVSFELENILEDTGIQIFCRERVEWQISFLSKEGSSNDFLLQLFQRYADEVHRPPRIAIFKVKHSDPSIKQQHIAICNKMIGEQTFLVGHFLIDATNFRGVYSHFGDIIFKELERTIVAQKEDMADCQNKENSIKGTTKHCDDTEEFSIYSEETFLKRGESSNRYLEDQKMKQLREQRQEESKKIDFYFPKKKREDRRKQKEHTLIPAALSSLSVNGDDEKKKRLKFKLKEAFGKEINTDRPVIIYQSLKHHILPIMDKISDKQLDTIIKSHLAFHQDVDTLVQSFIS